MTKTKKLGMFAIMLSTIAAPVITTISCGSSNKSWKYDQNSKAKIQLWSSLSSDAQKTPLADVVKKYNETNAKTDKDVEIVAIDGGYDAITTGIQQKLEAKTKDTLPNLAIAYPDTVGTIARYDMHLDLELDSDAENATSGISKDIFADQFVNANSQIAGVEDGFYAVPFAKSIDMLTANEPVLKYFMQELLNNNASFDSSNSTKLQEINSKDYADDVAFIGTKRFSSKQSDSSTFKISDDIFTSFEALLDFVIAASKVLTIPKNSYILGIDSPTNIMYSYGYSLSKADWNDFYFQKNSKGYIDYKFLKSGTTAYQNFDKIYSKMAAAIEAGGLYIRDVAPYSSDMSKTHKMALSMGSTAGFTYNYMASGAVFGRTKDTATTKEDIIRAEQLYSVTAWETKDEGIKVTLTQQGSTYTISLFSSEVVKPSTLGTYDYYSNLSASEIKTQLSLPTTAGDVVDGVKALQWDSRIVATPGGYTDVKKFVGVDIAKPLVAGTSPTETTNQKFGNGLYFVDSSEIEIESQTGSLQAEEMSIYNVPSKFAKDATAASNEKMSYLVQGPSLVGVHANKTDNEETRKFLNWMYTQKINWEWQSGNNTLTETATPAAHFAGRASYILPTNAFLNDSANANKGNAAQKLAFATLKEIKDDANIFGFDNPVDYSTGAMRNNIATAIHSGFNSWYTATSNRKAWTTSKVISEVKDKQTKV